MTPMRGRRRRRGEGRPFWPPAGRGARARRTGRPEEGRL